MENNQKETVTLPISHEWPYLAGLTGLVNLLGGVEQLSYCGEFNIEVFLEDIESIGDNYFDVCYDSCNSISSVKETLKTNYFTLEDFREINKLNTKVKKAKDFAKSREPALRALNNIEKERKKIYDNNNKRICNDEEHLQITQTLKEELSKAIKYLEQKEELESGDLVSIAEQFTLNKIRYWYLQPIISQKGFLNPGKNPPKYYNTESHKKLFKEEYVKSAIEEIKNPSSYNSANKCFFIPSLPGTHKFSTTEGVFFQLSVSEDDARNYMWDLKKDSLPRISSLARLIMLLIPLGMAHYFKEYSYNSRQKGQKLDTHSTWGFIVNEEPFRDLYNTNRQFIRNRERESKYSTALRNTISYVSDKKSKRAKNYKIRADEESPENKGMLMLVELWANPDNKKKKSLVETLTLPDYAVEFFGSEYSNMLDRVNYVYSNRIATKIMKGLDIQPVIIEMFSDLLKSKTRFHPKYLGRIRIIVNQLKKGGNPVKNKPSVVFNDIFDSAYNLKNVLYNNKNWSDTKLNGYIFKLLNAAKTNNKNHFMDITFRLCLSAGVKMNKSLLDTQISTEKSMITFSDAANAFIGGLLAESNESSSENNCENSQEENKGVENSG